MMDMYAAVASAQAVAQALAAVSASAQAVAQALAAVSVQAVAPVSAAQAFALMSKNQAVEYLMADAYLPFQPSLHSFRKTFDRD